VGESGFRPMMTSDMAPLGQHATLISLDLRSTRINALAAPRC
jgi:hypothetical protein